MKILAITYCFVPLQFPATFRLLKWFKYLGETGHEITVVSVDPDSFAGPKAEGLERLVSNNVENITVRSPENDMLYRLLGRGRSFWPSLFQPFKKEWYGPTKRALRSLQLDNYDVVFSCSQPPVCHLLGAYVKQTTDLPWVAYFSDPWVDNPYRTDMSDRIRNYNGALERQVIEGADQVIFSSEETKQLVLRKYSPEVGGKSETLDHCYVPEWFQLAVSEEPAKNGPVRVVITGSFYGPRTPIPFLEMLARLDESHGYSGKILFEFYGNMGDQDERNPIWSSVEGLASYRGSVDYLISLSLMKNADYLMLIDAQVGITEESLFFPSKLAEYIGSGNPILGLTPAQGTAARILCGLGHTVLDWGDESGLGDVLGKMARKELAIGQGTVEKAKYDYRCVGRHLVDILENGRSLSERVAFSAGN